VNELLTAAGFPESIRGEYLERMPAQMEKLEKGAPRVVPAVLHNLYYYGIGARHMCFSCKNLYGSEKSQWKHVCTQKKIGLLDIRPSDHSTEAEKSPRSPISTGSQARKTSWGCPVCGLNMVAFLKENDQYIASSTVEQLKDLFLHHHMVKEHPPRQFMILGLYSFHPEFADAVKCAALVKSKKALRLLNQRLCQSSKPDFAAFGKQHSDSLCEGLFAEPLTLSSFDQIRRLDPSFFRIVLGGALGHAGMISSKVAAQSRASSMIE
jgi:hypothetical protein